MTEPVDVVFWPVALDFKRADVVALDDGELAAAFINGAVRTSEQQEMAELLRRKSGAVVAFGSCAVQGGIPGLANLYDARGHPRCRVPHRSEPCRRGRDTTFRGYACRRGGARGSPRSPPRCAPSTRSSTSTTTSPAARRPAGLIVAAVIGSRRREAAREGSGAGS